jgi:hypothetical protein
MGQGLIGWSWRPQPFAAEFAYCGGNVADPLPQYRTLVDFPKGALMRPCDGI